jgi:hypothetical protein
MTMFDIETSIRDWKRSLLAREGLLAEHADELEDHVREELARLRGGVLSDDEAFLIATRRLGGAEAIAQEFDRSHPRATWRRRWTWMLLGYLALNVAFRLILTTAMFALAIARAGSPAIGGAAYSVVLLLGLAVVIAFARWTGRTDQLAPHRGPLSRRLGAKTVISLAVLATAILVVVPWGGIWANAAAMSSIQASGQSAWMGFMVYPQLSLWLAPIIALWILVWLDRNRLRSDDALLASADRS